jgi:hypothetical protein
MGATHYAICADDDLCVLLRMADDGAECECCGSPGHWQPVNADGGPGPICESCAGDRDWRIVPIGTDPIVTHVT